MSPSSRTRSLTPASLNLSLRSTKKMSNKEKMMKMEKKEEKKEKEDIKRNEYKREKGTFFLFFPRKRKGLLHEMTDLSPPASHHIVTLLKSEAKRFCASTFHYMKTSQKAEEYLFFLCFQKRSLCSVRRGGRRSAPPLSLNRRQKNRSCRSLHAERRFRFSEEKPNMQFSSFAIYTPSLSPLSSLSSSVSLSLPRSAESFLMNYAGFHLRRQRLEKAKSLQTNLFSFQPQLEVGGEGQLGRRRLLH
jgi:hypothetical protein